MSNSNSADSDFLTIDAARNAIKLQIAERNDLFPEQIPSHPWDICNKALSYVFDLPEIHLKSIRLHCDIFLGENTPNQLFFHGDENTANIFRWLGEGVDSIRWASEPSIPALGRDIGAEVDGKRVTMTTFLMQRYFCNLQRIGLRDGQNIVEIGAGYGGLAEPIIRNFDVRYTIIDLPETLIFSAAFLIHHFPDKKIYVYTPGDDPDVDWSKYDVILIPSYRAEWLRNMGTQDMAINTVSFPEMSTDDLKRYRDILLTTLKGPLFSVNYEGRANAPVSMVLGEKFSSYPSKLSIQEGLKVSELEYNDLNFRPTIIYANSEWRPPNVILRDLIYSRFVLTDLGEGSVSWGG